MAVRSPISGVVLRWKDLKRHRPAELVVVGAVHSPHAAFAQLLLNLVVRDPLPDGWPGRARRHVPATCPRHPRGPVEQAFRRRLRQQGFHLVLQFFIPAASPHKKCHPFFRLPLRRGVVDLLDAFPAG
jgi:hypothetical protein